MSSLPYDGELLANFQDLMTATLPQFQTSRELIATTAIDNNYNLLGSFLNHLKVDGSGGKYMEDQISILGSAQTKAARYISPYAVRTTEQNDTISQIIAPWTTMTYSVQYGEDEILLNSKKATMAAIKRVVPTRRVAEAIPHMSGVQNDLLCLPTTSTTAPVQLYGLPYMIVPITATQSSTSKDADFRGANPYGFTDYYGLDRSTTANADTRTLNAGWENTDGTITEPDRHRLGDMFMLLNFQPAPMVPTGAAPMPRSFEMWTNRTVRHNLSTAARSQNDQLGIDITKYEGMPVVNGLPAQWNPNLDNSVRPTDAGSTVPAFGKNPLVLLNWAQINAKGVSGKFFKHRPPVSPHDQPDVSKEYIDTMYQMMPKDPQKCGAVISLDVAQ